MRTLILLATCAVVSSRSVLASDFDVVINEILYNPVSGDNRDEYVEIHNRGGTKVVLDGWSMSEGIFFVFPPDTILEPREYLLLTSDVLFARERYDGARVLGNYVGRLDNGGEILTLSNRAGDIVSRVHYGDGGIWPSLPDGSGPSLERMDPHGRGDIAATWAASFTVDGSPGRENTTLTVRPLLPDAVVIEEGAIWQYIHGDEPFPENWREPGFDDSGWFSGPSGIGYDDDDDATVLPDMEGSFLTFAARHRFTVSEDLLARSGSARLEILYDDGVVGYLNGERIVTANVTVDADGTAPHDREADDSHEADDFEAFSVPLSMFVAGENVLAFQVHNQDIDSGDASFVPRLVFSSAAERVERLRAGPVFINEIKPTEGAGVGFVELYNSSSQTQSIGGHVLRDSTGRSFTLPGGASIPPGGFFVVEAPQLGYSPQLAGVTYFLVKPDGSGFVDALNPRQGVEGDHGFSFGRYPDGDDDGFVLPNPSYGAPNGVDLEERVVINEFYYHPPYVPPFEGCETDCSDLDQWIELHNRGAETIDISNWELTKAINFDIPQGVTIDAGDYLIIAASRARFLESHPGIDPARVLGDWDRALSHSSDTINLRDELENLVDHVKYGDGNPVNDDEPRDDIDDRTFQGSEWPHEADTDDVSVELRNPHLDNRHGRAWVAGPSGGTPGEPNNGFETNPSPVVGRVTHAPAVPRANEPFVVTCRISSVAAVTAARVVWHEDGGGATQTEILRDDGLSGDGEAGDGTWGATLPGLADGTIVAYSIEVDASGADSTIAPRPFEVAPHNNFEGPFYLVQALDREPPPNPSPSYFLILTESDRDHLFDRELQSNVLLPATFIAIRRDGEEDVHHVVGLRFRGEQTRRDDPKPFRVDFPSERRFDGMEHLNLNSQEIDTEILAADLFHRAGEPGPQMWTVNLTFRGTLYTRYARKENMGDDFLERFFGGASDDGNFYRAIDPNDPDLPDEGDLTFLGEDADDYRPYYEKRNNREEDDYSDIIELCRVFDLDETPDDEVFADRVEELVAVDQWTRYFALQACITNSDGSIHNRTGEDYLLYRVPATSRRDDAGKWVLIPWDIEETYRSSTERLFRPELPNIRRFLRHPRFVDRYYCNLMNLRDGVFSRFESRQRFRLIDFLFSFGTIDGIDATITARLGFLDQEVPRRLSSGAEGGAGRDHPIPAGSTWRFFRGVQEPDGAPLEWTGTAYDDAAWEEGPAGFGYGDGDDATFLGDMEDNYTTVYLRGRFEVADPAATPDLVLQIDYDDGFIAYLNGTPVADREVDELLPGPIPFDETAPGTHEADPNNPERISLAPFRDLLVAGTNVLAVQGLNTDIGSSDFSLAPAVLLEGPDISTNLGCGEILYSSSSRIEIGGRADACWTRSVRVNGALASWDPVEARYLGAADLAPGVNTVVVEAFDASDELLDRLEVEVHRFEGDVQQVEGTLAGGATWTRQGGPYVMTDDVVIPAGEVLNIEPGTVVFGDAGSSIIVRGQILAEGTAEEPILFRAMNCAERWGGIAMDDTGTGPAAPLHVLRHCDFEFGSEPDGFEGCIAPVDSRLLVENSSFRFLQANAIDGIGSEFEVRDSRFERCEEGVHGTSSTVVVADCFFQHMIGDKDAIDFDGDGNGPSRIEGCTFLDGSDDGVDLGSATVEIVDNVFINLQDKAISLERPGSIGASRIVGNLIFRCGTAIALKSGAVVSEGHSNTIVGNQEGLNLFAKDGASDGGHGTFHSMIIWDNVRDVQLDSLSTLTLTHSDVSSGVWPGEGNISRDPRFVDVDSLEFELRPDSPCIGTGRDGADMGATPFSGPRTEFARGDVNGDALLELSDAVGALEVLFRGAVSPPCRDRLDTNDDGFFDIGDPVYGLLHLFAGGAPPPAPFPEAGIDPTADALACP